MITRRVLFLATWLVLAASPAVAHFGMVIPEANTVSQPGSLALSFLFWHPMEDQGMDLARPVRAGVLVEGKTQSLLPGLRKWMKNKHSVWRTTFIVQRPGDYIFFMEPQAYWEPAEDKFIIHYSKTVVGAMGAELGWDAMVGLPLEIKPLTRPYGLYGGNSFSGQVFYKEKPLPGAEVEVEFYNQSGERRAPSGAHLTQVVRADERGVFTFTIPWQGWWGFAALWEDLERKIKMKGQVKPVELGGVIWVYAH